MNKQDFFRHCDRHNIYREPGTLGCVLSVSYAMERHGLDYILELHGSWGGNPTEGTCLYNVVELCRPAGQKATHHWDVTKPRLEKEQKKYRRWLKKWSERHNPHGVTGPARR